MGGGTGQEALRRPGLAALTWYTCVGGGAAMLLAAVVSLRPVDLRAMGWPLVVIVLMTLIGESRPVIARRDDVEGVPFSTAFVLASLVLWGPAVAVLLQAMTITVSELMERKPPWKLFFNVGQYVLSICGAGAVLWLGGIQPTPTGPPVAMGVQQLPWVLAALAAYHLLNLAFVAGLASTSGQTFWECFTEDIAYYTFTYFAVAALTPIVVVVAEGPWVFLPLLLLPLSAVWKTAAISREKERQALHDGLTDLPNRTLLRRRLEEALDEAAREGGGAALLLLDLDRFKEVNDTLGHAVGDRLLEVVAARAVGAVRPSDTVARLGGDEFAVVLPGVITADEAVEVAGRVRGTLADPVRLDGQLVDVDVSIGVALYPRHGQDPDTLLRRADVAMYAAKGARTGVSVYHPSRDPNSSRRLGAVAALRAAIEGGVVAVHYQPGVALRGGGVEVMEALARWTDPDRGPVPPEEFVGLAERAGLIADLTAHVLSRALADTAERWRRGLHVPTSVNVTLRDLTDGDLASLAVAQLEGHGLPAEALVLEVTESSVVHDPTRAEGVLHDLAGVGVRCWLDDFGTGSSSLALVERLPVVAVKVDRSFVRRLDRADANPAMVRSIVGLAHGLDLRVVAEGVQTGAAWKALADMGADVAQGWHVARPMPADASERWLVARTVESAPAGPALRVVGGGPSAAP